MRLVVDGPVRDAVMVGAVAWAIGALVALALVLAEAHPILAFYAPTPVTGTLRAQFLLHGWFVVGASELAPFTLVPVVVLLVSGYRLGARTGDAASGAVAGGWTTVGYFALALLSFVALAGVGAVRPTVDVGLVVVVAGVAYPVVFGVLGGLLAHVA